MVVAVNAAAAKEAAAFQTVPHAVAQADWAMRRPDEMNSLCYAILSTARGQPGAVGPGTALPRWRRALCRRALLPGDEMTTAPSKWTHWTPISTLRWPGGRCSGAGRGDGARSPLLQVNCPLTSLLRHSAGPEGVQAPALVPAVEILAEVDRWALHQPKDFVRSLLQPRLLPKSTLHAA